MATHAIDLTDALTPDPTATTPPVWQPSAILDSNDLYDGKPILSFVDTTNAKSGASCAFVMPANYVGTPTFYIYWKANATSGAVVWDVDVNAIAAGESADPSSVGEAVTGTTTTAGTARLLNVTSISATAGTFAVGDLVFVSLSRDCVQAGDTLSVAAEVERFLFSYADA